MDQDAIAVNNAHAAQVVKVNARNKSAANAAHANRNVHVKRSAAKSHAHVDQDAIAVNNAHAVQVANANARNKSAANAAHAQIKINKEQILALILH